MYGSVPVSVFGFFEEALPGSDIVPTATLGLSFIFNFQFQLINQVINSVVVFQISSSKCK